MTTAPKATRLRIFDGTPEPEADPALTRWKLGGVKALVLVGSRDELAAAGVRPEEMQSSDRPGLWVSLLIA